jgi:hypothetical protein
MNQKQKLALVAGSVAILAMALYPPWTATASFPNGLTLTKRAGYHPVFDSPAKDYQRTAGLFFPGLYDGWQQAAAAKGMIERRIRCALDASRLIAQCAIALAVTLGLLWVFHKKQKQEVP